MAARLGQAPAGVSFKAENPSSSRILGGHEKLQLIKRLPAPFLRHLLAKHRAGQLSAKAAAAELGLAHTRFYRLYSQYLQACAAGQAQTWSPRVSGGDHRPDWPCEVTALLTKLLSSKPASSYSSTCASELHRRLNFKTNRASVRRWAIQNHLAPDTRYKTTPKPVKRWQACEEGALWQYDVSPHPWLPNNPSKQALFDLLDTPHATTPAPASMHAKRCSPTWISYPAPSKPTARPWPSMSTTTPSSTPITQTLSLNWAPRSTSTASPCASPPPPSQGQNRTSP